MCGLCFDLLVFGTLSGLHRGSLSASPNKSCLRMVLLKPSLVCYSFPLQEKLKIHSVQKPLRQLLAFGHHEIRDVASSQKVQYRCSGFSLYLFVMITCWTLRQKPIGQPEKQRDHTY